MRKNSILFFSFIFIPLVLTGCGKKTPDSDDAIQQETSEDSEALGPSESLYTEQTDDFDISDDDINISEGRTSGPMLPVYFDFDSSFIQDGQVERIEHNGDFLRENSGFRVRIEGNCDARGTNEYNLALGERRALAAERYLINLGIDPDRLSTISWGEEKSVDFGQNELSWSLNRRDDFVLVQ